MKIYRSFYLIMLLFAASCESFLLKEVEVDDGVHENKIVVQSFISPQDTIIRVAVRYAELANGEIPEGKESDQGIRNAKVKLSNGTKSVILSFFEDEELYAISTKEFLIEAGETYTLEVVAPEYLPIKATSTVPKSRIDTSKIALIIPNNKWEEGVLFSWEDIPNEYNYYHLIILDIREESGRNLIIENDYSVGQYEEGDGRLISRKVYPRRRHVYNDTLQTYSLGLFAAVDYNYYEFHRTFAEQTIDIEVETGLPAAIFGNIEGGFGIFAAYNGVLFAFD